MSKRIFGISFNEKDIEFGMWVKVFLLGDDGTMESILGYKDYELNEITYNIQTISIDESIKDTIEYIALDDNMFVDVMNERNFNSEYLFDLSVSSFLTDDLALIIEEDKIIRMKDITTKPISAIVEQALRQLEGIDIQITRNNLVNVLFYLNIFQPEIIANLSPSDLILLNI